DPLHVCGPERVVLVTKKDFSFRCTGLSVLSLLAIGLIVCAVLFGLNFGVWFAVGMAALIGGYILYYTSNVLHHHRHGPGCCRGIGPVRLNRDAFLVHLADLHVVRLSL
ncbi:MAG: hypothetical protein MK538_14695, partial [Planctomycetes bacterium]|nr:hypothetical protein [Planctomycetota bacterium]